MSAAELTVGELLKEQGERLRLELLCGEKSLGRRVTVADLNRPGLALSGFLDRFRYEPFGEAYNVYFEQFAYEFYGAVLSYHHVARLLRDPAAEVRVRRVAVDRRARTTN